MKNQILIISFSSILTLRHVVRKKSKTTGWNYNDPKHGGFEVSTNYTEQVTLLMEWRFIEGGSF